MDLGPFFQSVGLFLWQTAYIWVLIGVVIFFANVWMRHIQQKFITSMDWIMLELKVPREVHKSPEAMEVVLQALHDVGGTANWYARWWKGGVRGWHSLEIVSIEGSIYFFIRTQRKFKEFVTAAIYSQYPNAHVREVDDYTRYVPPYKRGGEWGLFGLHFILKKPDPYPIKTYIDYGMDKDLSLDEEQRLDPMSFILEILASMRTTEHVWIQILIRAATKRHKDPKAKWWQIKRRGWVDAAKDEINKFRSDAIKANLDMLKEVDKDRDWSSVSLTEVQKETLTAMERSITKKGFDAAIRLVYMGKNDHWRPGSMIGALMNMWKVYGHEHLNSFKFSGVTGLDYPWQDIKGRKVEMWKEAIFQDYIHRRYFYSDLMFPNTPPQSVMTTEEIATLFHLPSRTAETPAFERIEAVTAQPPVNLPME